jgi:hypothetical protein
MDVYDTPFLELVYRAASVHRMYNDPSMVSVGSKPFAQPKNKDSYFVIESNVTRPIVCACENAVGGGGRYLWTG